MFGLEPVEAVRRGLVSAVLQTGGLLKDLTMAETVQYASPLFPIATPVAEVIERAGIAPSRRGAWVTARGASSNGCASPWRFSRPQTAYPRRADPGHGRRGTARLLGGDPP